MPVQKQPLTIRALPEVPAAPVRVLAVDPGTRYMGVAILIDGELLRSDVENIRQVGMTSTKVSAKAQRMLRRWMRRHRPDVLAVEPPHFAQSKGSRSLRRLVSAIRTLADEEGVEMRCYPHNRAAARVPSRPRDPSRSRASSCRSVPLARAVLSEGGREVVVAQPLLAQHVRRDRGRARLPRRSGPPEAPHGRMSPVHNPNAPRDTSPCSPDATLYVNM